MICDLRFAILVVEYPECFSRAYRVRDLQRLARWELIIEVDGRV